MKTEDKKENFALFWNLTKQDCDIARMALYDVQGLNPHTEINPEIYQNLLAVMQNGFWMNALAANVTKHFVKLKALIYTLHKHGKTPNEFKSLLRLEEYGLSNYDGIISYFKQAKDNASIEGLNSFLSQYDVKHTVF